MGLLDRLPTEILFLIFGWTSNDDTEPEVTRKALRALRLTGRRMDAIVAPFAFRTLITAASKESFEGQVSEVGNRFAGSVLQHVERLEISIYSMMSANAPEAQLGKTRDGLVYARAGGQGYDSQELMEAFSTNLSTLIAALPCGGHRLQKIVINMRYPCRMTANRFFAAVHKALDRQNYALANVVEIKLVCSIMDALYGPEWSQPLFYLAEVEGRVENGVKFAERRPPSWLDLPNLKRLHVSVEGIIDLSAESRRDLTSTFMYLDNFLLAPLPKVEEFTLSHRRTLTSIRTLGGLLSAAIPNLKLLSLSGMQIFNPRYLKQLMQKLGSLTDISLSFIKLAGRPMSPDRTRRWSYFFKAVVENERITCVRLAHLYSAPMRLDKLAVPPGGGCAICTHPDRVLTCLNNGDSEALMEMLNTLITRRKDRNLPRDAWMEELHDRPSFVNFDKRVHVIREDENRPDLGIDGHGTAIVNHQDVDDGDRIPEEREPCVTLDGDERVLCRRCRVQHLWFSS